MEEKTTKKKNQKSKQGTSKNTTKKNNQTKPKNTKKEIKEVVKEEKIVKTEPNEKVIIKEEKIVKEDSTKKEVANKKVETKKIKTEVVKTTPVTSNEVSNLLKIILAIIAIFLIFYGITTLVTKNKKEKQPETGDTVIQYDEILLGTLFEQPNSEYYVLVTKEDDKYSQTYSTYLSTYKTKEKAVRFYASNLDNGFNKAYKAEQSYTNITNIKELKLSDSTLLKIKDKKIVAVYEGNAKIIEHFKTLIK